MRATSRLAAVLALPLVLTACAEKDRVVPTDHATPRAVPSVPATVFPKPSSLAPTPDAPSGSASGTAVATTGAPSGGDANTVLAKGVTFAPATLKVKVGTKVTWNSAPGEFHTVTSGDAKTAKQDGPMDSPMPFTTYTYTFDKAGTYKYFCKPHAAVGMAGEIVVS